MQTPSYFRVGYFKENIHIILTNEIIKRINSLCLSPVILNELRENVYIFEVMLSLSKDFFSILR